MPPIAPGSLRYRDLCPRAEPIHAMRFHWKPQPRRSRGLWRADYGIVNLVEEGGAWLVDGAGGRRLLQAGDVSVIGPGLVFGFEQHDPAGCANLRIAVPGTLIAAQRDRLGPAAEPDIWRRNPIDGVLSPDAQEVQTLRRRGESLRANPPDDLEAEAFALEILRLGRAKGLPSAFAGLPDWLRAALVRMNSREYLAQGPAMLALLAGRHLDHVNRVLRRTTGKSATEVINGLRLEFAANRLRLIQAPVADIARDAGYSNVAHFYRLFRATYGVTPAAYRRRGRADGT
ncbi:MAG: hypothetical protein RLZZ127_107 [Planctomycetota bacterium]|jgi:AraC family cel operon transcriptional repressor